MPTTFTSCYSNVQGKCNIEWKENCNTQGNQITLKYDQSVHHVTIGNHFTGSIDTSQYVANTQMQANYLFQATQTSSNPIVWATYTVQWVCGQAALEDIFDGNGDAQPWHQNCQNQSSSSLPYDKVYIYYRGGFEYNGGDIQQQYMGIMLWLEDNGWVDPAYQYTSLAGDVYHTIIGGGSNRWLDWATSAYTGQMNNAGVGLGMGGPSGANIYNGDCNTSAWDDHTGSTAAHSVGDAHIWSHNTAGIYDFYCSTDVGLMTSATSTGQSITSLGLPPAANPTDKVLVIILNDESTCTYHGSSSTQNITVNGTTYPAGIDFNTPCMVGGDTVNEGNQFVWKRDYTTHLATINAHSGAGGSHNGVNWVTMPNGDLSQPKNYSYTLHVTGCITNGNQSGNTGLYNANSKKYHPTINNASWGPDGIPVWSMPPGVTASDGTPCVRILETTNPYSQTGSGNLESYGWTFPKFFGGADWNNTASPYTVIQPQINPPNNQYNIPPFPIQLQETIDLGFGTTSVACNPPTDCITVQAIDLSTINSPTPSPVPNYDIDFGALGVQTTDANGYAFFNNITPGTYNLFDTAITTQGNCLEYLYEVYVGTCTFTPTEQCACGCMDPNAINYDPNALCDDGSCRYDVFGCTDPTACNYDPLATIDNGTCTFPGCTDPAAPNYNATAGCDDGSCEDAVPDCDIAYGQNDPGEHLTDVDIKRIETEALFADDVYKHFQAMRFGMTSPCANSIDRRASEKYLCFWEEKKEKEYTGYTFEREVFKPEDPGVPPETGTYPDWVDPLCGLTEKGKLTVYFFYDGTSLGQAQVKAIHATTELWIQTLAGQGFDGNHYHTIVHGERWIDWATCAITGEFNNAGKNCTPAGTQSLNPPCTGTSEAACRGGCYAMSEFATGQCGCHQNGSFNTNPTVIIQDWAQNGDCTSKWYDAAVAGTSCALFTAPNYTPIGTSVTWSGPPPPAATEQVLVVCFADETETRFNKVNNDINAMCYHEGGTLGGTVADWNIATVNGSPSPSYKADYDKYLETYIDFTSRSCNHKMSCFLYPSYPANVYSVHRPFPLHALGAISSGNKATPDGTWNAGTAPTNAISPMTAAELSNPYWSEPNANNLTSGYGGLDRFGWGVNVAQVAFTSSIFTSDLNNFFDLNLYQCDDNECLVFDVVNQNGKAIKDFEIYLDGKDVGKTNEFGRYTHVVPKASANNDHTAQLCECFKTSGDCAQQRIKITATEACPDIVCTDPDPQCTCNAPANLQVTGLTHENATLNWSASSTTEASVRYDLRYRVVNATTPNTWIEVNDISNTYYSLTGLSEQVEYEFQVRAECVNNDGIVQKTSDWNALQKFTTTGLCPEIKSLLSICDSATTYTLGWIVSEVNSLNTSSSNGKWGVIWGTSSSISYVSGATPTGGGVIETTMSPGTANTYPASGNADTIITQTTTGSLVSGTTYYWRAYIDMAGCSLTQTEIKSFTVG